MPWGDGLDYSMRLHWFEDIDEDENRPYDMEEPNFFGLSISYHPYMREVVQLMSLPLAAAMADAISAEDWGRFSVSCHVRPTANRKCRKKNDLNGDYDFYRPVIRVENHE